MPWTKVGYSIFSTFKSILTNSIFAHSFAYVEMSLIMAKLHWKHDLELVNKDVNWEGQSRLHVMWSKPELWVRFHDRTLA